MCWTPLMEDRVPVLEICRYFAFAEFLEHGRSSIGLAPTIVWDCILVSASVFTVALPATKQMLKGKLRSVDRRSHRQNTTASSQRQLRESARQASARPSMDALSQIAEKMPPLPLFWPLPSSETGLNEICDGHNLRGMPSCVLSD
jgi:hypothetical protein